jgi:hypothetical protein
MLVVVASSTQLSELPTLWLPAQQAMAKYH